MDVFDFEQFKMENSLSQNFNSTIGMQHAYTTPDLTPTRMMSNLQKNKNETQNVQSMFNLPKSAEISPKVESALERGKKYSEN